MDQVKIIKVVERFFNSLKTDEDKMLETGLTHNATIILLHQACVELIKMHPDKFIVYVKWFLSSSMYLLDETEDLLDIRESDFIE